MKFLTLLLHAILALVGIFRPGKKARADKLWRQIERLNEELDSVTALLLDAKQIGNARRQREYDALRLRLIAKRDALRRRYYNASGQTP
jgi:hypothetical protein